MMSLIHRAKRGISKTSPRKRLMASPGESGRAEAPGRLQDVAQQVLAQQGHGVDEEGHVGADQAEDAQVDWQSRR